MTDRNNPAYAQAMADVRDWVSVYLMALKNDAWARAHAARQEGNDRMFKAFANRAGAYFHAASMIAIDAHLSPELISQEGDKS